MLMLIQIVLTVKWSLLICRKMIVKIQCDCDNVIEEEGLWDKVCGDCRIWVNIRCWCHLLCPRSFLQNDLHLWQTGQNVIDQWEASTVTNQKLERSITFQARAWLSPELFTCTKAVWRGKRRMRWVWPFLGSPVKVSESGLFQIVYSSPPHEHYYVSRVL